MSSKTTSSPLPLPTRSALTNLLSAQSPSGLTPSSSAATAALPLEILHNLRHQHGWIDLRIYDPNGIPESPSAPPDLATTGPRSGNTDNHNPTSSSSSSFSYSLDLPLDAAQRAESGIWQTASQQQRSDRPDWTPPLSPIALLSGTPPKPLYIHPDLQLKLLKAGISPNPPLYPPEREWVLPTSLARQWTLRELCAVFDALPVRDPIVVSRGGGGGGGGGGGDGDRGLSTKEDRDSSRGGGGESDGNAETMNGDGKGGNAELTLVQHQDAKRVLLAMKAYDGHGGDGTIVYYIVQEGEVKPRQN